MPVLDRVVERESPEHRELAMREVDDAHDAEQQREAERDQDIDRAQADAVDEHLAQDVVALDSPWDVHQSVPVPVNSAAQAA